jgi:primosomal protein N' (replication factor Y)
VQSAGRAGRGEKPGRVLIQSRNTSHYCWQYVRSGDYQGFYEHELEIRRRRRYPPFVKLALVRLSWPWGWAAGKETSDRFAAALRRIGRGNGCTVLGPAPAPISRMQGRLRSQCLIKAEGWKDIRAAYMHALKAVGTLPREFRVSLDIDPVSML